MEVDYFYNPARVFEAEMEWVDNKFKSTKVSAGVDLMDIRKSIRDLKNYNIMIREKE